jgi:hypothetical protein
VPPSGTLLTPVDHSTPLTLLADIEAGTLFRSLVLAAVLVTPYFLYKRRQVRAVRAAAEAATVPTPVADDAPDRPRLEDVIGRFDEAAAAARQDGAVTVTVPTGVTVDGDDAPPGLVDALVRDGLRRSGLVAVAEVDTATGRTIECHPAPPPAR